MPYIVFKEGNPGDPDPLTARQRKLLEDAHRGLWDYCIDYLDPKADGDLGLMNEKERQTALKQQEDVAMTMWEIREELRGIDNAEQREM